MRTSATTASPGRPGRDRLLRPSCRYRLPRDRTVLASAGGRSLRHCRGRRTVLGDVILGGVILETFMSAIGKTPPPAVSPPLTQREMMIVFLMAAGHTASEIAALLELAPRTVENRKRIIYEKLGVGNQSHAVAKAIALGLLQPGSPPTLPRRGP